MDILDGAVAVGTLATAVAAVLGLRAAAATARTSQLELAAQWQPLLIAVPIHEGVEQQRWLHLPDGRRITIPDRASTPWEGEAIVQATGGHGEYVVVPFRNVGRGVGQLMELSLFVESVEVPCSWRVEQSFLAAGESTRGVVSLPSDSPARQGFIDCARQQQSGIGVGIAYSNLSGGARGEVIFGLTRLKGRGWHISTVSHHVLPTPIREMT